MKTENLIVEKTFDFALQIISFYIQLRDEKNSCFQSNCCVAARVSDQMLRNQLRLNPKRILSIRCQSLQRKPEKQDIG